MSRRRIGEHAVVIGASMGGLLAARVLADHFARVTIVERDAMPPLGEHRKGVPQGRHAHGLLARGREILEDLFPCITEELVARGALRGDVAADAIWHAAGGVIAPTQSGLTALLLSRPLLEGQVRARVLALANVTLRDGSDVLGLTASPGNALVTGVSLRRPDGAEEELAADLVVDASGRAAKSRAWLETLGYAPPAQEEVRVGLGYTTRLFRRRPEQLGGKLGFIVTTQPPNPRGGAVLAIEGDRWIVSLAGYFGEHAPAGEKGFLDFAAGLPARGVYDLVRAAEPISDFATFKFPASTRNRYEALRRFPAGYLVFGDAISRFNPVFGQGMTAAALQAAALAECLAVEATPLWRAFFAKAARVVDVPWSMAVGADLAFSETEGRRGPMVNFLNWYVARLHRAAQRDPALALAFHRVANLMAPPPSLLRPAIAWRVLRGNLGTARQAAARAAGYGAGKNRSMRPAE
jgi:2-polyprenyl-6-methoxyphenol hydroxylase-like FAD-dependent oxidoreductase